MAAHTAGGLETAAGSDQKVLLTSNSTNRASMQTTTAGVQHLPHHGVTTIFKQSLLGTPYLAGSCSSMVCLFCLASSRFCFSQSVRSGQKLPADPRHGSSVCAALLMMQLPGLWLLAWLLPRLLLLLCVSLRQLLPDRLHCQCALAGRPALPFRPPARPL